MEIIIKAEPEEILSLMEEMRERRNPYKWESGSLYTTPANEDKQDDNQHYMVSFFKDGLKTTIWKIFDSLNEAWSYALALKENYKKAEQDVSDFKISKWNPSVEDWKVEVKIK